MGEVVSKSTALLEQAKQAAEGKDLKSVIANGKEWLKHIIASVQQFSQKMEEAGEPMNGEEKKAVVIAAAQEQFTPLINKVFNLPLLSEETEAKIINKAIEAFISRSIDSIVKVLKANGWVVN